MTIILAAESTDRDFTKFDYYLDTQGLIAHEEGGQGGGDNAVESLPLRAQRQDTGQNPFASRPEYGDFFAQGDFSHGEGQTFFHRQGANDKKFHASHGFDISTPGVLKHVRRLRQDTGIIDSSQGFMEIAGGILYVSDSDLSVKRGTPGTPGTWTAEGVEAGEATSRILDLASSGNYLFVCLVSGHIHRKDASVATNPWTHYVDTAGTGFIFSKWVKDRLMACTATTIHEITASGPAPAALETLATGWSFIAIGENGEFIYAIAYSTLTGQCRIHHYGLNSSGALVKIGSTAMPRGYKALDIQGYLDVLYIAARDSGAGGPGSGRPCLFQGFPGDNGELRLVLAHRGFLNGTIGPLEPQGDHIVMGWCHQASDGYGGVHPIGAHNGLAHFHLGRTAFSESLYVEGLTVGSWTVRGVKYHNGQLVLYIINSGLYFEDITPGYANAATLVSSQADWSSAGVKSWDRSRLSMRPLPATSSVIFDHTTDDPAEGAWTDAATQATSGATVLNRTHRTTEDPTLAVRIRSTAATDRLSAPEVLSFEVRSNPKPEDEEFRIVRTVRIFPRDRKDDNAEEVYQDAESVWSTLRNKLYTWVTFYERGITWTARLERVVLIEPLQPVVEETLGEAERTGYVLQLTLVGSVAA